MSGINLLPQESKPKGYAVNATKTLKKFSIFSIIFLLLTITVITTVNLFYGVQTRTLSSKEESLKKEIKALEDTEQKLVLIKNRLNGISSIMSESNSKKQIEMFQRIIEQNPADVSILGAKLENEKFVINVGTDDSKKITNFYRLLASLNFDSVELDSFTYDVRGYRLGIAIN